MRNCLFVLLAAASIVAAVSLPAHAAEADLADYFQEHSDGLIGAMITKVPQWECGIFIGSRRVREGAALTQEQLTQLQLAAYAEHDAAAVFSYLPLYEDGIGAVETLHLTLRGSKNRAPTASDSHIKTYKNLEISGTLSCEDPDGDALTYTLISAPRRGNVELHSDGSFLYTPGKNKVGTDRFIYAAADSAGNESPYATVTIQIENPRIKATYADMHGDEAEYEARFLLEEGIFEGETVGGVRCFSPEKPVSGEEFLMMLMSLLDIETEPAAESAWFSPWQQGALRAGLHLNTADAPISKYDAAILVSSALDLTDGTSVSVFADAELSQGAIAVTALSHAGLPVFSDTDMTVLTRREAAVLLCAVAEFIENDASLFPWQ